jgi:hypothetical protein
MKMKQLVTIAVFTAAVALVAPSANAITAAQKKAVKKAITGVPVPEMPAKAAELVKDASKEDREGVAVEAVRAAIYKSRTSAPVVVSAIVKAAPELAATVTQVASEIEHTQAGYIAGAAISAAPASKAEIMTSANRGVALANTGGASIGGSSAMTTAPTSSFSAGSVPASSPLSTMTTRSTIVRSGASTGGTAPVVQSDTPISGSGSFSGENAQPASAPQIVDYTRPRT